MYFHVWRLLRDQEIETVCAFVFEVKEERSNNEILDMEIDTNFTTQYKEQEKTVPRLTHAKYSEDDWRNWDRVRGDGPRYFIRWVEEDEDGLPCSGGLKEVIPLSAFELIQKKTTVKEKDATLNAKDATSNINTLMIDLTENSESD